MNEQTKHLAEEMSQRLVAKFPELQVHGVTPSYADPNNVFISVTFPGDERKEMEIRHYASLLADEYLDQYHTLFTPISGCLPSTNGHH